MHYIDECALADPLLARLPAKESPRWRIGHFIRQLPADYRESIEQGKNLLSDQKTARYWASIRAVTRGSLLDKNRFIEILGLNFGLIQNPDWEMYRAKNIPRSSVIPVVAESDIKAVRNAGTPWNAPGNIIVDSALEIVLTKKIDVSSIDISVDNNDIYKIAALRNNEWVQLVTINPTYNSGLARHEITLKEAVSDIVKIRVEAKSGDARYSIGRLLVANAQ